ncbi:MAG: PstS family phosphate ABC transporter substrate-binding protein [Leptolyngbyaceae cyanobacterium bins.349]|nr:PstS family phosphate ABC transporter substrate-binding protein [Leptolyngbyaceae cyanobacterium bins.349]
MLNNTRVKSGLSFAAIAATLTLAACSTPSQAEKTTLTGPPAEKIVADGSSTVYPITDAVTKAFRATPAGAKATIEVKFAGSTAGFRRFCAGETDISNASRPILKEEMATCVQNGVAFIELPVAFDALTIAVNPKNSWAKDVTVAELKKIWERAAQGKINNWNQVRASYPKQPLNLFGAGADSGTFDYFNEVVTGSADNARSDYVGSEDDRILVQGITKFPGALGYIPHAYYKQSQGAVKALPVDNGNGAVAPDDANIKNATYQPFSRPLFIYVNSKSAQDKPELRAFVEFYLQNAPSLVETIGYLPLPADAYRLAEIQFTRGEIGTAFEGVPEPNITVAELLRRQTTFQAEQASKP